MGRICGNCKHFIAEGSRGMGRCEYNEARVYYVAESDCFIPKEKEDKMIKLKAGCEICKKRLIDTGLCHSGCSKYPPVDVKDDISKPKPPLGVTPSFTVYEPRLGEIDQAIERYIDANKEIPIEWVEERNNLLRYFIKK